MKFDACPLLSKILIKICFVPAVHIKMIKLLNIYIKLSWELLIHIYMNCEKHLWLNHVCLGALVRTAKSLISFLMFFCVSVCFSVCVKNLDSLWTSYCDTLCWRILVKICWESQVWLKLTKTTDTSWRLKYIFSHSVISSIAGSIHPIH
jgi:hypothetical protein